jgi:hypothetical protein
MKIILLFVALSIFCCGCARDSELEMERAKLAEAQRQIEVLENERVPRTQYDNTRASLKVADEKINALERELTVAETKLAAQVEANLARERANGSDPNRSATPTALGLIKGEYEQANETYVYSPESQLAFGRHLQISSPTGLMVTDPEQKIVGGDLSIRAKEVTLETSDGLLMTTDDGSVKFTGKTLTMKFEDKKSTPAEQTVTTAPLNANATDGMRDAPMLQPAAPPAP